MGKIHTYPSTRKVFIEDVSVAVHIAGTGLIKGYYDASRFLKVKIADIDAACLTGTSGAMVKGKRVRLATLKECKTTFPGYQPINHARITPTPAKPTTVRFKIGTATHAVDHRSMMAARKAWELSQTQFDIIVAKRPGWRQLLPGCMDSITVHPPGWKPKGGKPFHTGPLYHQLFELHMRKNGSVSVKYIGPSSYPDANSVPLIILNNA